MEDDTASKKSDALAGSDKTLSKSSLYAPLTAYASGSLRIPKRVAKSHSEAYLVDWLHRLSTDYHQSCQPGDPRNTGNRSLSNFELQDKIMHRTLSLFGKGYAAKLGRTAMNASPPPSKSKYTTKHKKRNRVSKNVVVLEESFEATQAFLNHLNRLWRQYMLKVLDGRGVVLASSGTPGNEQSVRTVQQASRAIYECAHAMEWVGACVQIEKCQAFESWKGREGILVSISKNTWIIVERLSDQKHFRKLVLPRKGSRVVIFFQLSHAAQPEETPDIENPTTLRITLALDSMSS